MTVSETGMGNVCDKAQKIKLAIEKTPGVEDLITEVNTGDHGMTLYELPLLVLFVRYSHAPIPARLLSATLSVCWLRGMQSSIVHIREQLRFHNS